MAEHVSPASRERVVQDLAEHFAQDRLTLPEYEKRVELAYKADSADALRSLTIDLVPLPPVHASPAAALSTRVESPLAHTSSRLKKTFIAVMSGILRKGIWIVAPRSTAVAIMGGISLDLREARLSAPVTDINVFAMMGGVEIIIPPDVRLESDGFAIMGGFEDQLKEPASQDPNAPLIRVHGVAFMGGVEVRVAVPGEEEEKKKRISG